MMHTIQNALKDYIGDPSVVFVFPTDIAASGWADYALNFTEALALERFIAWDRFKSEAVRAVHQNKKSIPAVLRRLFALQLLDLNAKKPFFTSLIPSEYSSSASGFADWIVSLLPQLALWKKKRGENSLSFDSEDDDLYILEKRYRSFLEKHSLFEPAWEMPPFNDDDKRYIIVYPEILQDFEEYRLLLEASSHVRFIGVPSSPLSSLLCNFTEYADSRTELRKTALFIRSLCAPESRTDDSETEMAFPLLDWNDVALSIPDSENLIPYVMRELTLYNIPVRLRSGKRLSLYSGGNLFTLIQRCNNENFSFDSVRSLLTDPAFPWKDETAVNQLIAFGIEYNCLVSYDNIDVWEQAFSERDREERAATLYRELKKHVKAIAGASCFQKLREYYFAFAAAFFNPELFTEDSNRILSRCISELGALIDIEADYPDAVRCSDALDFFVSVLDSKDYLAQSSVRGVNVFSYRVAAAAPFKCHIIINASQDALNTVYRPLSFLNEEKRFRLNVSDRDVSALFIRLYAAHSDRKLCASFARKSFSGYTIAHNVFDGCTDEKTDSKKCLDGADFFSAERSFLLGLSDSPPFLHSIQKKGFFLWISASQNGNGTESLAGGGLSLPFFDRIREKVLHYALDSESGKIKVSASDLKSFYTCPLQWLFSHVFRIREYTASASAIDNVFIGIVYHEIIRRVLNDFKKNNAPLSLEKGKLPSSAENALKAYTHDVIENLPDSCRLSADLSSLTLESFRIQEKMIVQKLTDFFYEFICWFAGSFVSETEKILIGENTNYILKGIIDCILYTEDTDSLCIVDFKTGSPPQFGECIKLPENELSDFQLLSYISLYENAADAVHTVDTAVFFSIHKGEPTAIVGSLVSPITGKKKPYNKANILPRNGLFKDGVSSVASSLQELENAAASYAAALTDKTLPLFTDPQCIGHFPGGREVPYKTCADCAYKALCRKTYNSGRKQ